MSYMRKVPPAVISIALLMTCVGAVPAFAQNAYQADEIVVSARRSGIPVWRIKSDTATVVLVGTIAGVTTTTKWDSTGLVNELRKADRVMFPVSADVSVSPFAMIGYLFKWRRQAILPVVQRRSGPRTSWHK